MAAANVNGADVRERILQKLKTELRSILITVKGGSTLKDLECDYEDLNGHPLPVSELGFRNTADLLHSLPDVVEFRYSGGQMKLFGKSTEATRRIESLIQRQRPSKISRFGGTNQLQTSADAVRRVTERRRCIQQRVLDLLSRANGPVLYRDFCREYQRVYGELFDPKVEFNLQAKTAFIEKFKGQVMVTRGNRTGEFYITLNNGGGGSRGQNHGGGGPGAYDTTNRPMVPSRGGSYQRYRQSDQSQYNENLPPRMRPTSTDRGMDAYSNNQRDRSVTAPQYASSWMQQDTRPKSENSTAPPADKRRPIQSVMPSATTTRASMPSTATINKPSSSADTVPKPYCFTSLMAPKGPQLPSTDSLKANSSSSAKESLSRNLKSNMASLLSKYSNGIELQMLRDAYIYNFKCDLDVTTDAMQNLCSDICDFAQAGGQYYVLPKNRHPQPNSVPPISLNELKELCKRVVRAYPSGISYMNFGKAYQAVTGRELDMDLRTHDLLSLFEEKLSDVIDVNENGNVVLLETTKPKKHEVSDEQQQHYSRLFYKPVETEIGRTVTEDALLDRIWFIALENPDHSVVVNQVPKAYQAMFGTPLPLKDWDDFSLKLFDFVDRFDFTHDGVLEIIAYRDYSPSDPLVIEKLAAKTKNTAKQTKPSSHDFVIAKRFETQTLPLTEEQLLSLKEDDPSRKFEVIMAQVETPSRFYVQLLSTSNQLNDLLVAMNEYHSDTLNLVSIPPSEVAAGTICACYYGVDQSWYRGFVQDVGEDGVVLSLVDFGTVIFVPSGQIYYLHRTFFSLPAQAIECRLAFLSPVEGDWSTEPGEILATMCGSSVLGAEIYNITGGVPNIYLTTVSGDGNSVCINDAFLEKNLAIFDESADVREQLRANTNSAIDNTTSTSNYQAIDNGSNAACGQSALSSTVSDDPDLDLAFEMDIVKQLRDCLFQDPSDLSVISLAKTVLSRKRLTFMKKISEGNDKYVLEVYDKLAWLEKEIAWLTQSLENFSVACGSEYNNGE